VHRDQGFLFAVENYGRWCNLDAFDGLNGILERLGLAERFIQLGEAGYEAVAVAFVHADKFLRAHVNCGFLLLSVRLLRAGKERHDRPAGA
jgi:hypothetical protein